MKFLIKIAVILLIVFACNKIYGTKHLKSDEEIRMIENLNEAEHPLELHCKTTNEDPCMNFPIGRQHIVKTCNISTRFKNVISPGICARITQPASIAIDPGNLKACLYNCTFGAMDRRSFGNLNVTPGRHLIGSGTTTKTYLAGDYGYFSIDGSGAIESAPNYGCYFIGRSTFELPAILKNGISII